MYTDEDEVRKEIERKTIELAGESKGITDKEIIIKVTSNRVIPLTVVDLPGICKVIY